MGRTEIIANCLRQKEAEKENLETLGYTTQQISDLTHISRNNVSMILNQMFLADRVIKIQGRPVRYMLVEQFEKLFNRQPPFKEVTPEDLKKMLKPDNVKDPFEKIIGYNGCLENSIKQAKSAIMYPPSGLHTLLLGPSGVGKTFFANTMAEYARNVRDQNIPFMVFNCADYYNNPQLLLSQLFGYVKGAFTGANENSEGIVAKADGGILFLDEIHRLPADGQEMLFTLIDNGVYSRLGESGIVHKANVMIIGATTENPNELLKTFLRRIPITITLPTLIERPVNERFEMIEMLFKREATNIGKSLNISSKVIQFLVNYNFTSNVGELKSYIKQICAFSFARQISQNKEMLNIEFKDIPMQLKNEHIVNDSENLYLDEDLRVFPNEAGSIKIASLNIYRRIADTADQLEKSHASEEAVNSEMMKVLSDYAAKLKEKYQYKNKEPKEILSKIVDERVIAFCVRMLKIATQKLNREYAPNVLSAMAFHFNMLLQRYSMNETVTLPLPLNRQKEYADEYEMAQIMMDEFQREFNIYCNPAEKNFIVYFLINNNETNRKPGCGLLVICHGDSTASSMAKVCNDLLNTNLVKAIDMPLSMDVKDMYDLTKNRIENMYADKGILLFADMGSLCTFGKKIGRELGIRIETIENVSTLFVLEALRRVLYKDETLDELYSSLVNIRHPRSICEKEKAIIVTCATGIGTAYRIKEKVMEILRKQSVSLIDVKEFSFEQIQQADEAYMEYISTHDVIACAGNINPKITPNFFGIEELMIPSRTDRFESYIAAFASSDNKQDFYQEALQLLKETTRALNCDTAVSCVRRLIEAFEQEDVHLDQQSKMNLTLHLGYGIERMLLNQKIIFNDSKPFLKKNEGYATLFNKYKHIIEEEFQIEFNQDEICYAIQVLINS